MLLKFGDMTAIRAAAGTLALCLTVIIAMVAVAVQRFDTPTKTRHAAALLTALAVLIPTTVGLATWAVTG